MKSKKKINKVPANVVSWYNKLYLERKGSSKSKFPNVLVEATKSWISLKESEKKYFCTKYEECKVKYNEKFLTCLQNAEPFMKEIAVSGTSNNDNDHDSHMAEKNESPSIEFDQLEDTEYVLISPNNEDIPGENELISVDCDQQENTEYGLISPNNEDYNTEQTNHDPSETQEARENETNSDDVRPVMSEPAPPVVKSGKEFFEMIRFTGEKNDPAWLALSNIERSRYNQAVLALKKAYISKYTTYLEKLSPIDLFDHYNKKIIDYSCCIITYSYFKNVFIFG